MIFFKKGDKVKLTEAGERVLFQSVSGKPRLHRNGIEKGKTGTVMANNKGTGTVRVRFDSAPETKGESYGASFWEHVDEVAKAPAKSMWMKCHNTIFILREIKDMDIPEKVLASCAAHLRKFVPDAVEYIPHDGIYVTLSNRYTVTVDQADVDLDVDDENGNSSVLMVGRSFVKIIDSDTEHGDLLDACLDALAQDAELQPLVNDLTTDGDNNDCEAIFELTGYGYVSLKVR